MRTASTLACVLGRPVEVVNVRAGRDKPGLRPQHLAVLRALEAIAGARVSGAEVGSTRVGIEPGEISESSHTIDVGTAGSVTLLAHALLPLAARAKGTLKLALRGGTDVPWSPTLDHFRMVFLPALERMGWKVDVEVFRRGFHPKGGGEVRLSAEPAKPVPLALTGLGPVKNCVGSIGCGLLPPHVPARIRTEADRALRAAGIAPHFQGEETDADSPGVALLLAHESQSRVLGVDALGAKGLTSEALAKRVVDRFLAVVASGAAVDEHLADQLLLPCALADGESAYTAPAATGHLSTQAALVAEMTGRRIDVVPDGPLTRVRVAPRP